LGGARATTSKIAQGKRWERACYVSGFPNWQNALQLEWRWKQLSRKFSSSLLPLERRMMALKKLLALEKSTTKAIPFSQWTSPPEIHWEKEEAQILYEK
jgi:hypothetical protein